MVSPKRNGLAIIEFAHALQANIALEFEKGLEENPLTLSWLDNATKEKKSDAKVDTHSHSSDTSCKTERASSESATPSTESTSCGNAVDSTAPAEDFELIVLRKLREAEERKRMTQQIVEQ